MRHEAATTGGHGKENNLLNYYLMKSYEISNYLLSTNAENIFDSRFLASSKHIITS